MPKTTKRTATKRAARIAKAHATELPTVEPKVAQQSQQRRTPKQQAPARGIARYPWAITMSILIIAAGVALLYFNHVGPFAPPAKQASNAKKAPAVATLAPDVKAKATTVVASMPADHKQAFTSSNCLKSGILSKITDTSAAPSSADKDKIKHSYDKAPAMTINQKTTYCVGINTNRGLIVLELMPQWAPETVNNFVYLAQNKFYDGLTFHRVMKDAGNLQIAQGGDPKGDGTGGPGYTLPDETGKNGDYTAGTISMARSDKVSGSQFFLNTGDNSTGLKGQNFNTFGWVVKGMDVALALQGPSDSNKNITSDVMNHVLVVPAS
ncbi:peptidylprolyl isomerase [Ktedonobacter racemifer]|uniref:peptidylprolyl isomerase n=1 Tax=Ktedonobacter racemifer DSM 44963 TaxID=485913 RepID=D6TFA4_KTERA|nr:peptidylprolyl isomerase [Ktedonobacter racemifer]EFH90504.1 peptidyl-prolyl cis-trans isomerase cyclophilin type [Ktedonobacter racemifer DSM 44963]